MQNKRIVILGGGESGVGSAILAKKKGFDVFLSDKAFLNKKYKDVLEKEHIAYEEGIHTEEKILNASEIIKSPGIPDSSPLIKKIRENNIHIISEIEFAGRYTSAKKICITGSNGKTTTTLLTYYILKNAGLNVGIAGNIGKSFAWQVATCNYDYYVLELSSFQLDGMFDFKADIAVLLNITPDHLDRYNYSFQLYVDSKFRIVQNQTADDTFIYCADDEVICKEIQKRSFNAMLLPYALDKEFNQGSFTRDEQIIATILTTTTTFTMKISELALKGKHNIRNSMASVLVAHRMELKNKTIQDSLNSFQNDQHRLEFVATVKGVDFINDSKATNVNSTWYALDSIVTPVVLILGGVDKGNDYSMLYDLVKEKVRAIVCLGLDNNKIKEAFEDRVPIIESTSSISEAVRLSYKIANQGDTVLLSPACASFDLFKSYEERGMLFKKNVAEL